MDPYATLALLGFLVFLFYIIYSFLNNTGNGGRRSESDFLIDKISENVFPFWNELQKCKSDI